MMDALWSQSPALAELFPLFGALLAALSGLYRPAFSRIIAIVGLTGSLVFSLIVVSRVLAEGGLSYRMGGWPGPIGIEYIVDALNAVVLPFIPGSALLTLFYSRRLIEGEFAGKLPQFHALYLLLITGLMGIMVTGDAFNLYVLIEITALSSYALLASGSGRAYLSTMNYLLLGTIGASFYLLGVGYMYIQSGTLFMPDLFNRLQGLYGSPTLEAGFILMMVGLWIKMGLFPLHGWLPGAYGDASTPASCLIAPLVTKVTVYVMIRIMYTVFSPHFVHETMTWSAFVPYLAAVAVVAGAVLALMQKDFKKMVTYVVVAEIGYMVGGAWLGNAAGLTGAVFHLVVDIVMTLCLFMVAGIMALRGDGSIESFTGRFRTMPWTVAAFIGVGLSVIGIPPTGGFFSKWYLLTGAIEARNWAFMAALLFSSLAAAVLVFRIIEKAFFGKLDEGGAGSHSEDEGHGNSEHAHAHEEPKSEEAPAGMLIPLWIGVVVIFMLGFFSGTLIENLIEHAIPPGLF